MMVNIFSCAYLLPISTHWWNVCSCVLAHFLIGSSFFYLMSFESSLRILDYTSPRTMWLTNIFSWSTAGLVIQLTESLAEQKCWIAVKTNLSAVLFTVCAFGINLTISSSNKKFNQGELLQKNKQLKTSFQLEGGAFDYEPNVVWGNREKRLFL